MTDARKQARYKAVEIVRRSALILSDNLYEPFFTAYDRVTDELVFVFVRNPRSYGCRQRNRNMRKLLRCHRDEVRKFLKDNKWNGKWRCDVINFLPLGEIDLVKNVMKDRDV